MSSKNRYSQRKMSKKGNISFLNFNERRFKMKIFLIFLSFLFLLGIVSATSITINSLSYSSLNTGNFKGIRKGTICEFGQIVGGTKSNFWIRNLENKRIGRAHLSWLSHHFKIKLGGSIPPTIEMVGFLEHDL